MKTARFEKLTARIVAVLERYAVLKKEYQLMESRMAKKDREISEMKKKLESVLQERDTVRRRIGGVMEKIEALDI